MGNWIDDGVFFQQDDAAERLARGLVSAVHHAVQLTQRVDDLVYIAHLLEHERGAEFVCGGASRGYVQRLRVGTCKS